MDALTGLRLAIGERVAVTGRNGAGKTTLLRSLAGHAPLWLQQPIGYVPQAYRQSLLPWLTVERNIALAIGARTSATVATRQLAEALAVVDLDPALLGKSPGRLSGGEQQRVALARALAGAPRTLLLDEPFSALDLATRALIRERLRRLTEARSIAMVLVSHHADDVEALADRVLAI